MEEQLSKLMSWATDWQLPISYSKCCIFDLSNKQFPHRSLAIDAVNIPFVKEVVDLGVTMDKKIKVLFSRCHYLL